MMDPTLTAVGVKEPILVLAGLITGKVIKETKWLSNKYLIPILFGVMTVVDFGYRALFDPTAPVDMLKTAVWDAFSGTVVAVTGNQVYKTMFLGNVTDAKYKANQESKNGEPVPDTK